MPPLLHSVALALGSNLGDRLAALRAARDLLARILTITALSPVYETPPAYVTNQPSFLNAALLGHSKEKPHELLETIKLIERAVGRAPSFPKGPRLIDIDIIFYDSVRLRTPSLVLPHPALAERPFVLRPLADIASGWFDPATKKTVQAMLDSCPTATPLKRVEDSL